MPCKEPAICKSLIRHCSDWSSVLKKSIVPKCLPRVNKMYWGGVNLWRFNWNLRQGVLCQSHGFATDPAQVCSSNRTGSRCVFMKQVLTPPKPALRSELKTHCIFSRKGVSCPFSAIGEKNVCVWGVWIKPENFSLQNVTKQAFIYLNNNV